MFRLLSLEYKKFRKNSAVVLLIVFYLSLAPSLLLVAKELFKTTPDFIPSSSVFFEFPTVWDYMGYVGNWLVSFFLGFVIIYMVTSEVSNKTMRQSIINGLNKKDYYLGKLYTVIAFSLIATLLYILSTIAMGIIHTDGYDLELILDNNMAPVRYFLMCMGYMSFAMMIGFVLRSSGLSIFIYLVWVMIIESILKVTHGWATEHASMNWYPMNTIEDLMPNPFLRMGDNFIRNEFDFPLLLSYNEAMIGSTIYIFLFLGLTWWSFKKRDL